MQESWHGDHGEELRVTCADGACLAEVFVPESSEATEVQVEITLQPRDPRGLPCGPPVVVQRERVPLLPQFAGDRLAGRFWLADGLSPSTVRDCYFRMVYSAPAAARQAGPATL